MKKLILALSIPVFAYIIINLFTLVSNGPPIKEGDLLNTINKTEIESRKELVDCEFFKMTKPKEYDRFVEWNNKNVKIHYFYSDNKQICAESSDTLNSIWINVANVYGTGCISLKATLGHEMMHIAKLPNHKFKDPSNPSVEEVFSDTIYTMELICLGSI